MSTKITQEQDLVKKIESDIASATTLPQLRQQIVKLTMEIFRMRRRIRQLEEGK